MNRKGLSPWAIVALALSVAVLGEPGPTQAATCTSTKSGNWTDSGMFDCGTPGASDDVTIRSGDTVTVDTSPTVANLTINGTLTVGNDATARTVTVSGDVSIASGATIAPGATNATHSLVIAGNLTNDGTFDGAPTTSRVINVTFNKNGNQTVSGTGTTRFNSITLNMGTSSTNVLEVQAVITMATGGLMLTNGTFKLSSASTITPFSGSTTIGSSAGFYLNHASATSNWGSTGSLTLNGAITIADGTMTVGSNSGNELEINGSSATVTVSGGTLKVAGRVRTVSSGLLTISGGEIVVPTVGQSSANASFYMQSTGKLTMSGGTVTIERANGGTGEDIRIVSGADSKSITGGTFQVGNASTPASQTMLINSEIAINNLTINSANATAKLTATLTANGNINIAAGTLDANNLNMAVAGNWTNNGAFTAGTGSVTFNGTSEQTVSGSSTTAFNSLTISSGATVRLTTQPTVDGTLTNNGTMKQTKDVNASAIEFLHLRNNAGTTDKYLGVDMDPGSNNLDSTTVAVSGNQTCPSPPSLGKDPIKRCFDISPTSQNAATIKLYYLTSELNGNTASTLNIYHLKNGLWYLEGGTYTRESDSGDYDWVQVTGVDEYSSFTAGNHGPTRIELVSFTATALDGYVLLEWETASETDTAGFNLWRARAIGGPYTRLNADLIPARGGPAFGAHYRYLDEAVNEGGTFWYKLEDVDIYGVRAFHGPVSATARQLHRTYLPLLLREKPL